ncbi:MAG: 50S ribosomal protein L16 [Candidatus Aenigmatarchaeota archaeon]
MGMKPGRCFHKKDNKPYTRISEKNPRKSYIKGVPGSQIKQFETGNKTKDFDVTLDLYVKTEGQIRTNAIEAARLNANKYLMENLTEENYFLKILVYPHHVLRENTLATGPQADRYQDGMRKAFGKPINTAARVDKNQSILRINVNESGVEAAREALKRAGYKIPMSFGIKGLEKFL